MDFIQEFYEEIVLTLSVSLVFLTFWMFLLKKDINVLLKENDVLKKMLHEKDREFEKITLQISPQENLSMTEDFTTIKGIGEKMAVKLQESGIRNFHQLANLNEKEAQKIITQLKIPMIKLTRWQEEARSRLGH